MKIEKFIKSYKTWGAWILTKDLKTLVVNLPGQGELSVNLDELCTKKDQEELVNFISSQNYYNSSYDVDLVNALHELTVFGIIKLKNEKEIK